MFDSEYDIIKSTTSGFSNRGLFSSGLLVLTLFCLAVSGNRVFAQTAPRGASAWNDNSSALPVPSSECPERKRTSFWRRTAEDTPEGQWHLAERLKNEGKPRHASRAFDAIVRTWHDKPIAARAQYELAELLEYREKHAKAFDAYQYLFCYYPGHFPYREVTEKQYEIAGHFIRKAQGFWGGGAADKAVKMLRTIARNSPQSPIGAEARLKIGELHELLDEYDEAILAYERFLALNATHPEAPNAAFRAARCRYLISERYPRDSDFCAEALSTVVSIISRFPAHDRMAELRKYETSLRNRLIEMYYKQAAFYDSHHGSPKAALVAYRDFLRLFPESEQAGDVRDRIEQLREMAPLEDDNRQPERNIEMESDHERPQAYRRIEVDEN